MCENTELYRKLIDFVINLQLTQLIGENTWEWISPDYDLFISGEFVNIKLLTGQYAGFTVMLRWTHWKPKLHVTLVKSND